MAVREGLMVLLAERPRHGYELRAEFESRTGELWSLNSGQVYTTLERLERDGMVSSEADPDDGLGRRRRYRLTAAGKADLENWLLAAGDGTGPPRDELVMKVLLAAQWTTERAQDVIAAHRRRIIERLQALRRRLPDAADSLAKGMVADVLVVRLEADLRWLDRCDERVREAASDPRAAGRRS